MLTPIGHTDRFKEAVCGAPCFDLLDVATDPGAHPPISLYDGTLDRVTNDGVVQDAVG